jgi:predicted translin family RNA/ssDNA-binding protein
VIDQCSIINNFIKSAYVVRSTGKIFVLFIYLSEEKKRIFLKNSEKLIDYLKREFSKVYADFYALSFDYLLKMFIEGILLKDISQTNHYYSELEYVMEKLCETVYEYKYREVIKYCKELIDLLKHDLCLDKVDNTSNDYNRQVYQEVTSLGMA